MRLRARSASGIRGALSSRTRLFLGGRRYLSELDCLRHNHLLLFDAFADTFAPVNSVAVLVDASRGATPSATTPVVLADAGVENVNAQVDDLITTGVLRRSWPSPN